ncbi:serine hydrolase domain-containing protein [Nonomuraea typhae]|uniref:serine hydrolase domain-containing protein n=1 Tax=Nonomuraea typhae TaxID=2603600 RepID=UPI0012FC7E0E|nr:serine hydrolase domain-containing protein [Nonomuraea typhae]
MRRSLIATVAALAAALSLSTVPAAATTGDLDPRELQQSSDAVHAAGMYGFYSQARAGHERWSGASGVADVQTRRPVRPGMPHRIGSITKTFVSVAILQQVERGRIDLDAPVARYLPGLIPGERGDKVTVRMLLNHTSGIGDHIAGIFPSLLEGSPKSLDDNRFRTFTSAELVRHGLAAPSPGAPGSQPGSYSNTNYVIAGLVLQKVTRMPVEDYITRYVIRRAGLRETAFPRSPYIRGEHSKAYENMYGLIDPPKDYSVYDMSWAGVAGNLVSTMDDLNTFYRALLRGKLVGGASLAEMRRTVKISVGGFVMDYGLGLYPLELPCGRFWGHDGGVFGMGTQSLISEDGRRELSFGMNLMKYQRFDENGQMLPNDIDPAVFRFLMTAACGGTAAPSLKAAPSIPLLPTSRSLAGIR